MNDSLPSTYPIARYRFDFQVTSSIKLPDYAGSMIRGAFGGALRHTACMTKERECKPCALYRTCPYPAIFETPAPLTHSLQKFSQIPNPFIIEPPTWGSKLYQPDDILSFDMVLIGKAINQLPLITYALQRAFKREVGGGAAALHNLGWHTELGITSIFDANSQQILDHKPQLVFTLPDTQDYLLQIETPLRIQSNGHALSPDKLSPRDLLMAMARRTSLLFEFHSNAPLQLEFSELSLAAEKIEGQKQLQWRDWTRFSSRQQQKMQLGGVVGQWLIKNVPPQLGQLLHIGQWLHIGKNATFGLGQYKLIKPKDTKRISHDITL